ncbi:MAG: hypothetical protein KH404_05890 [Bifidobacterium pseudolongum]|nr:hypothetical protein [Bifidobacterium pseudolongum]
MNPTTNTTNNSGPRNPWTRERLPPLPKVSHPENWIFQFEPDDDMYCVYRDDEHAPLALTFDVYAWNDGKLDCNVVSWTSDPLDLDELTADAARVPAWIAEVRAVTQWARQAFGQKQPHGRNQ